MSPAALAREPQFFAHMLAARLGDEFPGRFLSRDGLRLGGHSLTGLCQDAPGEDRFSPKTSSPYPKGTGSHVELANGVPDIEA
jgi:hypothetical protein